MRRNTQEALIAMKKQVLDSCLEKRMKSKDGAILLKMHPKAFLRLKARYIKEGVNILFYKKPGPKKHTPKNKTSREVTRIVTRLAVKYLDLGPVPLADRLLEEHGIKLDPVTVWRILKREKVRYTQTYKRWKAEPKLYCLDSPGIELQMDGCYPYGRARKLVLFDAIDDCSRWVSGKLYDRETCENAIEFVKHLVKNVPFRVQRIRVDNRYGSEFVKFCESIGIEVIGNEPYSPEQNGKIERFHKTIKREFFWKYCSFNDLDILIQFKLNQYLNYYNTKRKHSGYGMNRMTPQLKITSTLFNSLNFISYPQKVTLTLQQYKSA